MSKQTIDLEKMDAQMRQLQEEAQKAFSRMSDKEKQDLKNAIILSDEDMEQIVDLTIYGF